MPLPSSGPLSFVDLQTEFGGTNPIALNEYYASGGLVPPATHGPNGAVPTSGQIGMDRFYGGSGVPGVLSGTWSANSMEAVQPMEIGLPIFFNGKYWATGTAPDYGMHTSVDGITWQRENIVANGSDYSYSRFASKTVFEQDNKMVCMCADSPTAWLMASGATWSEPLVTDFIPEFNISSDVEWIPALGKYVLTYIDTAGMVPYPVTVTTGLFQNQFPLPTKATVNVGSGIYTYSAYGRLMANNSGTTLMKSMGSFNNPGILRSTDSGVNWLFVTGAGFTYGLAHSSTSNLFIKAASGALATSPNGTTWTTRTSSVNPYRVAAKENIVLACSTSNSNALDCSLTGGTTWQQVQGPGVFQQITDFDIVNGRFFMCGYINATHTIENFRVYSISATE